MKSIKVITLSLLAGFAMSANAGTVGDMSKNVMGGMKSGFSSLMNTAGNAGAVSAEIGTLGYGANVAWSANEYTEIQAGWTGGDIVDMIGDQDLDVDEITYSAKTDFSTPYVGLQIHPMKNWLTVGMGAMYMGSNSINASAAGDSIEVEYNNKTYKANGNYAIDAKLSPKNTMSPYLTVGVRPNVNNKFGLFGEVGAAYIGGMNVDINATGNFTVNNRPVDISKFEDDARAEIIKELDGNDEWYPIAKIGATYRF